MPTDGPGYSRQNTLMEFRGQGMGIYRHGGFTILELLVTLGVAAIVLLTAAPALQHFTWRQHMRAAVGNLHNDLLSARSEAVFQNVSVIACPGDPQAGCSDSSDWSQGWIVFTDFNGDGRRQQDETVVRTGQVFETLAINGSAGRHGVRFLPDGSAPGSNGTIGFCGPGGPAQARKLVISNIGRIRRDHYPQIDATLCPGR